MNNKLIDIQLDASIGKATPDIEHERAVAIFDLLEDNHFEPIGHGDRGPFRLQLLAPNGKLVFHIRDDDGEDVAIHILSLTPLRRVITDYEDICQSYYEAIRSMTTNQIEAIDMARRGIHNDGSEQLQERLSGKITIDMTTARRLFTLICVLK